MISIGFVMEMPVIADNLFWNAHNSNNVLGPKGLNQVTFTVLIFDVFYILFKPLTAATSILKAVLSRKFQPCQST